MIYTKFIKIFLYIFFVTSCTSNAFYSYINPKIIAGFGLIGLSAYWYSRHIVQEAYQKESDNQLPENSLRIVTANINLMPPGLAFATTGKPQERAEDIVSALLEKHPNTDVYVIQELYDEAASQVVVDQMTKKGFRHCPGPKKRGEKTINSGQAIFVKQDIKVEANEVLTFSDHNIQGIGVLETYVPKGVIHVKLTKNEVSISIFGYHLQAEVGLFAIDRAMRKQWSDIPNIIISDLIHLQPFQWLRERYPNYLTEIRKKQIEATMK